MRRIRILLLGLLVAAISFAMTPAPAAGLCYRLRVAYKGLEVFDQWVGVGCETADQVVSVTRQRVAETTIETIRYQ